MLPGSGAGGMGGYPAGGGGAGAGGLGGERVNKPLSPRVSCAYCRWVRWVALDKELDCVAVVRVGDEAGGPTCPYFEREPGADDDLPGDVR